MSTTTSSTTLPDSPDVAMVARIVALNTYGRKGAYLSESWGTTQFKKTYALAYASCGDEVKTNTGFTISWHPSKSFLSCTSHGFLDDRLRFYRELHIAGDLADTFAAELKLIAMDMAVQDLKAEEEAALRTRAGLRLELMMNAEVSAQMRRMD